MNHSIEDLLVGLFFMHFSVIIIFKPIYLPMTQISQEYQFSNDDFKAWNHCIPHKYDYLSIWCKSNISNEQFINSFLELFSNSVRNGNDKFVVGYKQFYQHLSTTNFPLIEKTINELENYYDPKSSANYTYCLNLFTDFLENKKNIFSHNQIEKLYPLWDKEWKTKIDLFTNTIINLTEHTQDPSQYCEKNIDTFLNFLPNFEHDLPYPCQLMIYNYLHKYNQHEFLDKLCPAMTPEACFESNNFYQKQIVLDIHRIQFAYHIEPGQEPRLSTLLNKVFSIITSDELLQQLNQDMSLNSKTYQLENNKVTMTFIGYEQHHLDLLQQCLQASLDYVLNNHKIFMENDNAIANLNLNLIQKVFLHYNLQQNLPDKIITKKIKI